MFFYPFYVRFYHCSACTVYFHCLHVRSLHVTLNINQSINQSLHPFNGLFSRTTWLSRHQKGKTSLDLNKARNDGVLGCSGIRWTMCKQSAPRFRQITTPTPHHLIFTGRMLYLTPDQQSQSTESSSIIVTQYLLQVVNLRLLHPALAEYCDEHVCLSVCPFARISLKPYVQTSPNFVCVSALPMAMTRSSSINTAISNVGISNLVDDVM